MADDSVAAAALAAAPSPDARARAQALAEVQRGLFARLDDTLADDPYAEPTAAEAPTEVPHFVGRYIVLEQAGHGGMGTVVRAYDPKLRREVALKRVNSEALSPETKTRLMREAQAMARLSHACVVGVHDVELGEDDVVVVMEYVRGQTLRQWLEARPRDWREIVGAFRLAGEGLAAAHRVGVTHRDFKPSNVMIALDGVGREESAGSVKVTDFGLAKGVAVECDLEEPSESLTDDWRDEFASPLTRQDAVLGTPRYMAPEQHAGSADERADQYSFCVALWEALCGVPPFEGRSLAALAGHKMRGPPPWPAGVRVPRRIVAAIRRGLAPRPQERWASMELLLAELSESSSWRRAWWSLGGAVVATTVAATAAWQLDRASLCSGADEQLAGVWDEAERVRVREAFAATRLDFADDTVSWVETELDRYGTQWAATHREACEATTLRGEQSSEVMDLRFACLSRLRQELAAATALLRGADRAIVENAVGLVSSLTPVQRCDDVQALRAAVAPPAAAEERRAVDEIHEVIVKATALRESGRFPQALSELDTERNAVEAIDYPLVRAQWKLARGRALEGAGKYEQAVQALEEGLADAMQVGAWELSAELASTLAPALASRLARPDEGAWTAELANALASGAGGDADVVSGALVASSGVALAAGDYEDAQRSLNRALELRRARLGDDHPRVHAVELNLALVLGRLGRYEEGEALVRTVLEARRASLGEDHPQVADAQNTLGTLLLDQSRHEEAARLYRRAIAGWERSLGSEHIHVAHGYANLGLALHHLARYDEAAHLQRKAYEQRADVLGADHPDTIDSLNNLGLTLTAQGKYEEAENLLRQTLRLREESLGPDHPKVATCAGNLAIVLLDLKRHDEAVALFRRALEIWERRLGPDHPMVGSAQNNLALALANQGRHEEAETMYRQALTVLDARLDPMHRDRGRLLHNLGRVMVEQGKNVEALPVLERAWEIRRQAEDDPLYRAQTAFLLARALRADHEEASATALAERALEEVSRARTEIDRTDDHSDQLEREIDRFLREGGRDHQPK